MSDTNENKPKPVLIKQAKPKPTEEQEAITPASTVPSAGEKRKVVVVKKKSVSGVSGGNPAGGAGKKPAARVVAHRADESSEPVDRKSVV